MDGQSLFDAAPEALLVVDEDLILHANAQAIELSGRDPRGGEIGDLIDGWIRTEEPFEATLLRSRGEPSADRGSGAARRGPSRRFDP